MIYFIRAGKSDIKIGFSKSRDCQKRLNLLQVGSPQKLKLIKAIDGNIEKEKDLQHKFRELHIRGEWFKSSRELIKFIKGQRPCGFKKVTKKPKKTTTITTMKTLTRKQIKLLEEEYGNHTQAARAIGIDPRYYRNLRSKKMKPGKLLMFRIADMSLKCKQKTLIQ